MTNSAFSFGFLLRVLLLDFDGKFTLLIPNIELGKAFRINKADVEVTFDKLLSSSTPWWSQVQTKELEGGHKLTFMKFTFQSPALEIKAPVLNDKTVGYQVGVAYNHLSNGTCGQSFSAQVLQQNGACVFLSRIFNIPPGGPGGPGVPQVDIQSLDYSNSQNIYHISFHRPLATPATPFRRLVLVATWLHTQEDRLDGPTGLPSTPPPTHPPPPWPP